MPLPPLPDGNTDLDELILLVGHPAARGLREMLAAFVSDVAGCLHLPALWPEAFNA